MSESSEITGKSSSEAGRDADYSFVSTVACVACYDNMKAAPRVTRIEPCDTNQYIENLTTTIYNQASAKGGKIPYTAIREVAENFIHAQFKEIVVSILNEGNTIRFADQGPGIKDKEHASQPGFTSATQPMKAYIRGVGSGLPIVKDYMDSIDGFLTIEDNINTGSVVTISLEKPRSAKNEQVKPVHADEPATRFMPIPIVNEKGRIFLRLLASDGPLGVTELANLTDTAPSSTHNTLKKLEQLGLVEKTAGQKRALTDMGIDFSKTL